MTAFEQSVLDRLDRIESSILEMKELGVKLAPMTLDINASKQQCLRNPYLTEEYKNRLMADDKSELR